MKREIFSLAINGKSQNVLVDQLIAAYLSIIANDSICESIFILLTTSILQRNVVNCINVHVGNVSNTSLETESQTTEYLTKTDIIYNYDELRRQRLRTRCGRSIQKPFWYLH